MPNYYTLQFGLTYFFYFLKGIKMSEKVIGIGAFEYDLFPYFVLFEVYGYSENGSIKCRDITFKSSALISIFDKKNEKEIRTSIISNKK